MTDRFPARLAVSPWARLLLLAACAAALVPAVALAGPDAVLADRPGPRAALLCVAGYALGTLAFVPKPALSAAVGAVFGVWTGLLVAAAGTTAGALLAFAAARLLGRGALRPLLLRSRALAGLDRRLARRAFVSVLTLRLLPVVPFAAVNVAAAVSRMRWPPFALGTLLGSAPGNAAWVLAGAAATTPASPALWFPAAAALALTALLPLFHRRRQARP
jgi:uncharacterized membrane protein YdjX (TVP38/TMEM64 family)